jgi:hypothetical protein
MITRQSARQILLRLSPALVVLSFLLLKGRKLQDFYLAKGKIDAPVKPSRLLGMKKPEPWTRIGSIFAVVFASVTFVYLMLSNTPFVGCFHGGVSAYSSTFDCND